MNKVILLVLLMPVTAFGQTMKNFESGNLSDRVDPGNVIITEIMADPFPAVTLPAKEYIEIFNRTEYAFNMKGWSLSDDNTRCTFPEKIILPGEYMILCHLQDTLLFNGYGKTTGLKSFPALTDGGKILFISDNTSKLIHGIEYSSDWYEDALKDGGGWSLEIVDTDFPFYQEGNWHASLSKEGGTPGKINSVSGVNPDYLFSGIENVFPIDSTNIIIKFSETVTGLDKNITDIEIEGSGVNALLPSDPLMREYMAILREPLQNGRIYTLSAGDEITDFAGNRMQRNEFSFGIPDPVEVGDILFNELLFNPFPGEPDFIELYNNSERVIDASDLILVSVNDELNDSSSVVFVSAEKRCILPGEYYAFTTDKESLCSRFFSSDPYNLFEVSHLPSMPDDNGHLILYDRKLDKIDEVVYNEDMHYFLLSGNEGISLEKIRTEGSSADKSQWQSASEASGWGTPGAPNSVLSEQSESNDKVVFSSTRITPDNDGNEDFLIIDLKLTGTGNVISITVFNETGSFVKKLTDNLLAGPEASIVWDGTAEDEKLVSTGIFIILISIFDDSGKVQNWKKVCTVIRR
jgi:hypothetical protein